MVHAVIDYDYIAGNVLELLKIFQSRCVELLETTDKVFNLSNGDMINSIELDYAVEKFMSDTYKVKKHSDGVYK